MAELYQLDEETDYAYDIQGWLEDYLDDLDMRESKEKLLEVCDELIGMFRWEEEKPSDIRFLKSAALKSLGRAEEAAAFCKKWLAEEPLFAECRRTLVGKLGVPLFFRCFSKQSSHWVNRVKDTCYSALQV